MPYNISQASNNNININQNYKILKNNSPISSSKIIHYSKGNKEVYTKISNLNEYSKVPLKEMTRNKEIESILRKSINNNNSQI